MTKPVIKNKSKILIRTTILEYLNKMTSLDDDKLDYGFCHHCKQLKNKYLLATCNYNSSKMGLTVPASYTVKDVKIYNSNIILLLTC